MTARNGRWAAVVGFVLAAVVTLAMLVTIGAGEAALGQRVLGGLDPLVDFVRARGQQSIAWLVGHAGQIGWVVNVIAVAIAFTGLVVRGSRAAPLVLLGVAVFSATSAQVLLTRDVHVLEAVALYLCGIAGAIGLGICCPMARLHGFSVLTGAEPQASASGTVSTRLELIGVFLLVLLAITDRLYALTEIPNGFDLETLAFMVQSRTLDGIRLYVQRSFLGNAPGVVHLLTQHVTFGLFGTSIYSLRVAALVWGVAAVPLFYWLVRRIAGVWPALAATLLFATAPEQLFWSRSENAFFAPIAALALVTAHLSLWMVERTSPLSVLLTALWMPFSRFFYLAGIIMFALPVFLGVHALVFVRGAWRKAWYVVPLLVGGVALWVCSVSFLLSYVNGWGWRFVNPAIVYGAPAWRKHGEFSTATVTELVGLQAVSIARNLSQLVTGMTYRDAFATHWYARYTLSKNPSLNVGLAVLLALGVGYLVGQLRDRRAALLLAGIVLGVLPTCLSNEPTVRRITPMFPFAYATAGVMLAACVRVARQCAPRWLAALVAVLLGAAVVVIAWTSLASHLLLQRGPVRFGDYPSFTRRLFEETNTILTNIVEPNIRLAVVFGNLDGFLAAPPCFQFVDTRGWLEAVVRPTCDFKEPVYELTMSAERMAQLRRAYRPRRVTYLLQEDLPAGRETLALLRRLYPESEVREFRSRGDESKLVAVIVDTALIEALHAPVLETSSADGAGGTAGTALLAGVNLVPGALPAGEAAKVSVKIEAGLMVDRDGWYRFDLAPPCPDARLTIGEREQPSADPQPLLAGVHRLELSLAPGSACRLPFEITERSAQDAQAHAVGRERLLSPTVAGLEGLAAPPLLTYPGYGAARLLARVEGSVVDLGVDANGVVSALTMWWGRWRLLRLSPEGREVASIALSFPRETPDPNAAPLAVGPDGSFVIAAGHSVLIYGPDGQQLAAWDNPFHELPGEIALWHGGNLLMVMPARHSVVLVSRDGRLLGEMKRFQGGPGRFVEPAGLTVGPQGEMLVIQANGQALLFQSEGDDWLPKFVRSFHLDFAVLPIRARGAAYDTSARIVVPDLSKPTTLVYTPDGVRMLAETREHDLTGKGFGAVSGIEAAAERLYVLDRANGGIWSLERRE